MAFLSHISLSFFLPPPSLSPPRRRSRARSIRAFPFLLPPVLGQAHTVCFTHRPSVRVDINLPGLLLSKYYSYLLLLVSLFICANLNIPPFAPFTQRRPYPLRPASVMFQSVCYLHLCPFLDRLVVSQPRTMRRYYTLGRTRRLQLCLLLPRPRTGGGTRRTVWYCIYCSVANPPDYVNPAAFLCEARRVLLFLLPLRLEDTEVRNETFVWCGTIINS